MTGFQELAPAAMASALGFGMVLAFLAGLKHPLSQKMEMPEERISLWVDAAHLALIPCMLASGVLADHWGARGIVVAGSLLAGLALFGLSLSHDVWTSGIALAGIAAGASALSVGSILLIPDAFFGPNAASANFGLLMVPLGGLITGGLLPALLKRVELRRGMSVLALVCLIPAFIVTVTPSSAFQAPQPAADSSGVWSSPVLWLASLAFLLYGPVEGALGAWAATYLTQTGFSERRAGLLMTGFWATFLASRLGAAFVEFRYVREAEPWVIITLAGFAAIAVAGLAGTYQRSGAVFWLFLIALTLGPIFPNLVGTLYRHFGPEETGTAYGVMFFLGGGGGLLLPPVLSLYARRTSVRTALRVPAVICLLLAAGSLALALTK
jgi:MFS family permease